MLGNQQKIENLKQLITASVMLSVPEKEEWLSLVELMNDKQMTELMELLGQNAKPVTPAASSITPGTSASGLGAAVGSTPGALSHISNLPRNLTETGAVAPAPKTARPSAAELILAESIAPPRTEPVVGGIDGLGPKLDQTLTSPGRPMESLSSVASTPSIPTATAPTLTMPQESANLTVDLFRRYGSEALSESLKNLVINYGYFSLMEYLENSPLFNAYLRAGQQFLSGRTPSGPQELSQQEFESVADVLRALRINRL